MIIRKYELVGKYRKLFDATRGKFHTARTKALYDADQTIPNFKTWEYLGCLGQLTITWDKAPSYLEEDDLFDCFEREYDSVA